MAGGGAGGWVETDLGKLVKAVATAGGATRGRSGSGGPVRARAVRFRPRTDSVVRRRRRSQSGAKLVDLKEDEAAEGETGVGQGGAAAGAGAGHAANQDGAAQGAPPYDAATGAEPDGATAGARHVAHQESAPTCAGHGVENIRTYY